jgi:hypothetical protein
MKQTFLVNGLSCLVEGNSATVYVPKKVCHDKKEHDDACNAIARDSYRARCVGNYLVSEGFVDGKIPIGICFIHPTNSNS